jgi:hypothetical protein
VKLNNKDSHICAVVKLSNFITFLLERFNVANYVEFGYSHGGHRFLTVFENGQKTRTNPSVCVSLPDDVEAKPVFSLGGGARDQQRCREIASSVANAASGHPEVHRVQKTF